MRANTSRYQAVLLIKGRCSHTPTEMKGSEQRDEKVRSTSARRKRHETQFLSSDLVGTDYRGESVFHAFSKGGNWKCVLYTRRNVIKVENIYAAELISLQNNRLLFCNPLGR